MIAGGQIHYSLRTALTSLAVLLLTGCFSGSLGDICSDETECDAGMRCFQVAGAPTAMCTVGCTDAEPCATGVCTLTPTGNLCLRSCDPTVGCGDATLSCQQVAGGQVCWWATTPLSGAVLPPGDTSDVTDPSDIPMAPEIVVARVEIINEENDDGRLSAGESGGIGLRFRNAGGVTAVGINCGFTSTNEGIQLRSCYGLSGSQTTCERTDAACDCPTRFDDFDLEPLAEHELRAVIYAEVDIDQSVGKPPSLDVHCEDDLGGAWSQTILLETYP